MTKRRFFLEGKPDAHLDHFVVLGEGKLADLAPKGPFEEAAEVQVELLEVDRHDGTAAVGKLDGFDVCVAEAAPLVGKRVKVRIERVLDGVAYATLVRRAGKKAPEPLTAEAEAEKPTRKPPARKDAGAAPGEDGQLDETDEAETGEAITAAERSLVGEPEDSDEEGDEAVTETVGAQNVGAQSVGDETVAGDAPAKKKTRRGSRGGKNRKKPAVASEADASEEQLDDDDVAASPEQTPEQVPGRTKDTTRAVTIHVPSDELGREDDDDAPEGSQPPASENGAAPAKKRTRRGSRGGKNRRKRTAAVAGTGENGVDASESALAGVNEPAEPARPEPARPEPARPEPARPEPAEPARPEPEPEPEPAAVVAAPAEQAEAGEGPDDDWGYVPMSEWGDEFQK
jgi:predicted RNA-binding protein with TRAM domain